MLTFRLLVLLALMGCTGCVTSRPVNPSFPVTAGDARHVLDDAAARPQRLKRPLVVIGGFVDPGVASNLLARDFRSYTGDDRIVAVPLGYDTDFRDFRRRIIDAVQGAFPSPDPLVTAEVDVIGYSMGGLAARYAAEEARGDEPKRRLRIGRLFTISSPLRGAAEAAAMPLLVQPLQENMRPGSRFLCDIDHSQDSKDLYPVYSYVCLGDRAVGAANAAVPGQTAWWVSPPVLLSSHHWAFLDPRIRADIVLRLRDEKPLSSDPASPLPGNSTGRDL